MLNSEYKLSKSPVQSQQPLKSYKKQPNNHGVHCPILILVPSETLTAITSYLDPPSLSALAVVNVYLNGHIKDDNTWRRAFFYQFLGVDPENDLDENKALLLRRTEGSWRNEFTIRYKLKKRWERSRNAVVTHVPVNSPISSMHIMPSHALLTSSIEYGIVARSLPLTGKILPGYLDTSGGAHVGLGIGNPNAEFTPNISACAISSDGGTAKIIWGTKAGDVIFMNAPRAMNGGRRNAADVRRCDIADKHHRSVLDAQWVVNPPSAALGTAVTASADGRIKLWDPKTATCQWTSQRKSSADIPEPCLKVTAAQTGTHGGCIAAVMKSGEIHIWTGFTLGSTAIYEENSIKETIIECLVSNFTPGHNPQATHAVIALHIDPNPASASPTLLVAYENDSFFYRIRVGSQPRTGLEKDTDVDITTFGDPFFGSTSIVVPYFRGTVEQQASFVLVGDHLGWVSLYAWDADNPSLHVSNSISTSLTTNTATNHTTIQAIRKFEAHPDSASVTALTWSPHTLITGSAKGTTHVFDALNFRHLRSFASPIPKTRGRHQAAGGDDAAAEMERRKVKQIIVGTGLSAAANTTSGGNSKDKALSLEEDRDLVFISVGERVMAWKAGPVPEHGHGGVRGRHTQGVLGASKKKRGGYAKYLQQLEVNQIILGSRHDHHQLLLDESKHKNSNPFNSFGSSKHVRETEREQRERLEHLGLSEVEAVEYVLMLSRDEANANARAEGGSGTSTFVETDQGMFEGDFDTERATDNGEEDDYHQSFTHSTVSGSRRSSTSSASIPTASSSHSSSSMSLSSHSSHSNLINTTRNTVTRPIPSSSNEKIQVSPPFRLEPMEAGQEWLGGYNAGSSTSSDANTSMREGMEAHIFPPIAPSGSGNVGNEPQGLDGKAKEKSSLKGRKENRDRKDNIEDTRKDKPRGRNKATTAEIPLPSPSSRRISNSDVGSRRTVNQNASIPPSTSSKSAPASAWNVPLSIGQNYGQRGSIISRPSSASTSTSASASAVASTAPRNAWASGGPSLSARISPPTATAAASLQSQLYHHHSHQQ